MPENETQQSDETKSTASGCSELTVREKIEAITDPIMEIAYSRNEVIKEYVNLANRSTRGSVRSLVFDYEEMQVAADWDYYEGFSVINFDQEILVSDAPLISLKKAIQDREDRDETARIQREKSKRDELLAKHPLDDV